MRFVLGVNDDYIYPSGEDWADIGTVFDNIGDAVDAGRKLLLNKSVWKVDIEARSNEEDHTLLYADPDSGHYPALVMVLHEYETIG